MLAHRTTTKQLNGRGSREQFQQRKACHHIIHDHTDKSQPKGLEGYHTIPTKKHLDMKLEAVLPRFATSTAAGMLRESRRNACGSCWSCVTTHEKAGKGIEPSRLNRDPPVKSQLFHLTELSAHLHEEEHTRVLFFQCEAFS